MIHTFEYRDWAELRTCLMSDLFDDGRFVRSRFLFRGQSDVDWPLISSYDRWFETMSLDEARRASLAQQLKDSFRQELCNAGFSDLCALQEHAILSLGQHHGLPTRLLDWSESPYVAAFFAFIETAIGKETETHVALWALDTTCYQWSPDLGAEVIRIDSPGPNVRLRNQEGRFTLLRTPQRSLEDYIEECDRKRTGRSRAGNSGERENRPLLRFSLPATEAVFALPELAAMGITPSRVYPDMQGLAMAATLHCRLSNIA